MIRFNTMAECKQIVKEIRYVVSAVRHVGKGMGILDIVVPSTMGRLGERLSLYMTTQHPQPPLLSSSAGCGCCGCCCTGRSVDGSGFDCSCAGA